ncbi:hypothetical protein Nepgr_013751 [Nepenthes gracilis]|uniref:Uncharacterized protein n=1 Tax=Nepenthes gracilis TaxID=150966 RepID=A0AAD3XPQ1_NEPGR|nr:hypothetical protein Nepgr_013751 [Nepenthes gracilis]
MSMESMRSSPSIITNLLPPFKRPMPSHSLLQNRYVLHQLLLHRTPKIALYPPALGIRFASIEAQRLVYWPLGRNSSQRENRSRYLHLSLPVFP